MTAAAARRSGALRRRNAAATRHASSSRAASSAQLCRATRAHRRSSAWHGATWRYRAAAIGPNRRAGVGAPSKAERAATASVDGGRRSTPGTAHRSVRSRWVAASAAAVAAAAARWAGRRISAPATPSVTRDGECGREGGGEGGSEGGSEGGREGCREGTGVASRRRNACTEAPVARDGLEAPPPPHLLHRVREAVHLPREHDLPNATQWRHLSKARPAADIADRSTPTWRARAKMRASSTTLCQRTSAMRRHSASWLYRWTRRAIQRPACRSQTRQQTRSALVAPRARPTIRRHRRAVWLHQRASAARCASPRAQTAAADGDRAELAPLAPRRGERRPLAEEDGCALPEPRRAAGALKLQVWR